MRLQRKCALIQGPREISTRFLVRRLGVIDYGFSVDFHDDFLTFDNDMLLEPLVVFRRGLEDVNDLIGKVELPS